MADTIRAMTILAVLAGIALVLILLAPAGDGDLLREVGSTISAIRGPVAQPNMHILRKHPEAAHLPSVDFDCAYYQPDLAQFAFFTEDPCADGDDKDLIGMVIYRMAYGSDILAVGGAIAVMFVVVTAFFAPRKRHRKMLKRDGYVRWK